MRKRAASSTGIARAFRDDLFATAATITGELGEAAPAMVVERLVRFVAGHEGVFERVDDSSGRVRALYEDAIAAVGDLAAKLPPVEADRPPEQITASLGHSRHGYLIEVAQAVAGHLPLEALLHWDTVLATAQREHEALGWVRRQSRSALRFMSIADLTDGAGPRDAPPPRRASLEARILDKLGEQNAAQALRWQIFMATLDAQTLRDYIAVLPDFEEFDARDRAFAHARSCARRYLALTFFLDWPCLDLAARLVLTHPGDRSGRFYDILRPAAALEAGHALSASLLYRALLDAILASDRSATYPHTASYLERLDALAPQVESAQDELVAALITRPTAHSSGRNTGGRPASGRSFRRNRGVTPISGCAGGNMQMGDGGGYPHAAPCRGCRSRHDERQTAKARQRAEQGSGGGQISRPPVAPRTVLSDPRR